jgi:catechol 2,3-dioxygenase-like lactoylglutathione lyase family enzyme
MAALTVEGFHTILLCRRWEECVAFYRDLFGFRTVDSGPGFVEVEVAPGSHIGLVRSRKGGSPEGGGFALALTFRVPDLEKAREFLAARAPGVGDIIDHPWGARLFRMQDPEGRPLEIWTRQ